MWGVRQSLIRTVVVGAATVMLLAAGHARALAQESGAGAACLCVQKNAPASLNLGTEFKYDICVRNLGRDAALDVVIHDQLPENVRFVSATPATQAVGRILTWKLGNMPAGKVQSIQVVVVPTAAGTLENCVTFSARTCAKTLVTQPKLVLEKTGPAEVLICDPFTYKVVVRNTGDGPITNLRVIDALPSGLVTDGGNTTVTCDVGTLLPGEAKQYEIRVNAKKRGVFVNKATATADLGLTAVATATTTVREPVLVVTKTGPQKRYLGRPVTFRITVANRGDGDALDTKLSDAVPAQTKFVSATRGGTEVGGKVTWDLGTLKPNASTQVEMTLMPLVKGIVRNTAVASAHCAMATGEAQTIVAGIPAILLEVIDLEDPVEVGANTTYEIVVLNQGSADGTNIVIVATLPPEEDLVSSDGPTKATVAGKVVTFAPLPRLAPKERATYRVVVKGVKVGDVRFAVQLTSDQMTSPAGETESTHIYE